MDEYKEKMTREDYIAILKEAAPYIRKTYKVNWMQMFGSTARGTNTEKSDVDLFIDMPPQGILLVKLGDYLENLLGTSVDLVRYSKYLNPVLIREIKKDGITIF